MSKFRIGDIVVPSASYPHRRVAETIDYGVVTGFGRDHPKLIRVRTHYRSGRVSKQVTTFHEDFWELKESSMLKLQHD